MSNDHSVSNYYLVPLGINQYCKEQECAITNIKTFLFPVFIYVALLVMVYNWLRWVIICQCSMYLGYFYFIYEWHPYLLSGMMSECLRVRKSSVTQWKVQTEKNPQSLNERCRLKKNRWKKSVFKWLKQLHFL